MTNPEQVLNAAPDTVARIDMVKNLATEQYGENAEFAYKVSDGYAMMTLDDALKICGQYIANAGDEMIIATLDDMRATAIKIESKGEQLVQYARTLGQQALGRILGEKE